MTTRRWLANWLRQPMSLLSVPSGRPSSVKVRRVTVNRATVVADGGADAEAGANPAITKATSAVIKVAREHDGTEDGGWRDHDLPSAKTERMCSPRGADQRRGLA